MRASAGSDPDEGWAGIEKLLKQLGSELTPGSAALSVAEKVFSTELELFIPLNTSAGEAASIAPGSAVIGVPADDGDAGSVLVFVEEPGDPTSGPRTFGDRIIAAVNWYYGWELGGHSAWAQIARDDLLLVGSVELVSDPHLGVLRSSEMALAKWLGISGDTVPGRELAPSQEWAAEGQKGAS